MQEEATAGDLINMMSSLNFVELPTGLIIESRRPGDVTFAESSDHALTMLVPVKGIGLLEIKELSPSMGGFLPSFRGAQVRGGELFKELRQLSEDATLLLIAPTAVARLYPHFARTTLGEAADVLAGIQVEWSPSFSSAGVGGR